MNVASERAPPRRVAEIFGIPRSAAAETVVFFAIALLLDAAFLDGTRFRDVTPHPFWLFLLVVSAHYGTAAGVFATVLGTLLALQGNLPARNPLESQSVWLVQVLGMPALWFTSAIVLGEIRTRRERIEAGLRARLAEVEASHQQLVVAHASLNATCERLQAAAAGQIQTTTSLLQAAQAVETQEPAAVLSSVDGLIGALLDPSAYSLYLRTGGELVLSAQRTDGKSPEPQAKYLAGSPLFQAVVDQQQILHVATATGQQVLGNQGVLAGPLLDGDEVIGMLKIEGLPLTRLRDDGLRAFRFLCAWIGSTYGGAQRLEDATRSRILQPGRQIFTEASYAPITGFVLATAKRAHFDVSQLTLRVTHEAVRPGEPATTMADVVDRVVKQALRATDLAFDCQDTRGEYLILLPLTPPEHCQLVADRVRDFVHRQLAHHGIVARISVTFECLYITAAEPTRPPAQVVRISAPHPV